MAPVKYMANNVPGISIVCWCLAANGLFVEALSLVGSAAVSLRLGGELPVAWLRRSSASRSLLCRASSSCACVFTACFLERASAGARVETVGKNVLLVDGLVQVVEAAVEIEQGVELVHEVTGNGAAAVRRHGSDASGRSYD